ncbi:bacterio-opsin activator domain-containing protein [Halalkalicoccus salilacus]|uniref:bacterio-opsin activator domain-containing protein n=1 Tax=Halalkalicoccus salilacus TaxID=3117459 RepID=UPI00300E8852
MAAIIEFRLPTEEFALEETLDTHPEAQIEIERVVADDPDKITPYIWARADDFDTFEAALEDDPTVESMTLLSETEEERSYQMTWTGAIDFIVHILTEHEGTITHADGSVDGWELRVLFPDHESLSEAHNAAHEAGFWFDVTTIYGTGDTRGIQHGLTDTQRNALVAAFEAGYFTVPREVTLQELAEQQDSSHQALSEQLRRATGNLVESTLITQSDMTEE